jgi:hypothetical protein
VVAELLLEVLTGRHDRIVGVLQQGRQVLACEVCAITRAPARRASWTVYEPTPPEAPSTSTVMPASIPASSMMSSAVTPATPTRPPARR